jgi:hypothetical protein
MLTRMLHGWHQVPLKYPKPLDMFAVLNNVVVTNRRRLRDVFRELDQGMKG